MKNLEIGQEVGGVFGLDKDKGQSMVYNGGISFTAKQGDKEKTIDCQKTYDKVFAYINRPSVRVCP